MLGFLILIPAMLVWFILMPPIAVLLWLVVRAVVSVTRLDEADLPYWLETPWDILTNASSAFFCVKVQDCDGQHTLLLPGIRTMRCAVMANHRSWGDFFVDPAMAHCAVMARIAAVAVTCIAGAVGLAFDRVIMINRSKDSRQTIFDKVERHERYLFYPEGTRRASHADADEPVALKAGGVKNVYEGSRPVLICICVNKERIINEKSGGVRWGVTLYRARSGPIDPADYPSFDAFLQAVEQAWRDTWRRAYAERDTCEPSGGGAEADSDVEEVTRRLKVAPSSSPSDPALL